MNIMSGFHGFDGLTEKVDKKQVYEHTRDPVDELNEVYRMLRTKQLENARKSSR